MSLGLNCENKDSINTFSPLAASIKILANPRVKIMLVNPQNALAIKLIVEFPVNPPISSITEENIRRIM